MKKAIITTILSAVIFIFVTALPTNARTAEPDTDTVMITELAQLPNGYDAGQDTSTYVLAILAE